MSNQHIPHQDLREALQAVLVAPSVLALATGGVVDALKDAPSYPAVRVVVRGRPVGAIAGHGIWECEAEIDIYSAYGGTAEAMQVANVIVGLLNLQPLTVSGWTVIEMSVQDLVPLEDELVGEVTVNRWQVPVLIHAERAA